MAPMFTSNMVLQRNKPIVFYGKGIPGLPVKAWFDGDTNETSVAADSSWQIVFKSREVNKKPQPIKVASGKDSIILQNILIGDVWLCFGQSNMEWPVKNETHYKSDHNYFNDHIRFFNPAYAGKSIFGVSFPDSVVQLFQSKRFLSQQYWEVSDNNSIRDFSAVAWYFGDMVFRETGIPQGLVNLSVGGAPIETFIREEALEESAVFTSKVRGNWLYNSDLPEWIRQRGLQNIGNIETIPADKLGPDHGYKPGFAFKNAIQHFTNFPIRGFLFYQGESNAQEAERVYEYAALMELLVNDYRKQWRDEALPFYFVQLSSIDTLKYKGHFWGAFRNEQRIAGESIRNGGMAVTSDIGDRNDVHPRNKKDVGERLAKLALYHNYNKKLVVSGPSPRYAVFKNNRVIIFFKNTAGDLKASEGQVLHGFSLDGITEVKAIAGKNFVEIVTATKPEFVYYGWAPFSEGNLVNAAHLPATTFKLKVR